MSNWRQVKLGEILTESRVESGNPDTTKRIRVKLNVGGVEKRPDTNDIEGATKYYIRKAGQFIYGKQNLHKGAFGIVPEELDGFESSSDIPALDVNDSCYPEWIFYFFKQNNFYLKLESLAKGVGSKRIHPKQLFELRITLPPKEEQKKILDTLDDFEQRKLKVIAEIEHQLQLIDTLKRNTILDAIQGKLTEKWRNEVLNIETSEDLLLKIKIKKDELELYRQIPSEKPILVLKKSEYPYELPQTWAWCRLDDIMNIAGGVTKGKIYNEELITTPYLRVANVQRNFLDLSIVKEITVSKKEYEKYQLKIGDLLMAEGGDADKVGRCAIWNDEIPGCIHQNHIFRLRKFDNEGLDENYVLRYINSPVNQKYYESSSKQTTNLASINKTIVRSTPIALPPYKEQKEISKKLIALDSYFKDLEDDVNRSILDVESLNHHVIKDVFGDVNLEFNNSYKAKEIVEDSKILNLRLLNSVTLKNYNAIMELEQILKENGKMSAISLWKLSKFEKDIDAFYEELKRLVEEKKTIKESDEKGFLELVENEN